MNKETMLFLEALGASLHKKTVAWPQVTQEEWEGIFRQAQDHRVLPLVYQAVHGCLPPELLHQWRSLSIRLVMLQTQKTQAFRQLLEQLQAAGITPLVVKGIVCRNLYPQPDQRLSADEDLLILPEQFALCNTVLNRAGLYTRDPASENYELAYSGRESCLYLELHRSLFSQGDPVCGSWNRCFRDAFSRAAEMDGIPTLAATDHMLYLLMHAMKHFFHSGFGIRQVCDLVLFANRYGGEIDWLYLLEKCRGIRGELFAAGLFRIGWKYLGFDLEKSRYPVQWQAIYVEEGPLLEDILAAGVYGSADEDRLHSSSLTVNAVHARNRGKAPSGLIKTLFPPAQDLQGRYPYLTSRPILLPLAWAQRLVGYSRSGKQPAQSLRIGRERIELLKKYGMLDKK